MQKLRPTYRTLAACLLLTISLGVLAPAGISAAGIFCDMGPEAILASAHARCDDHALPASEGHAASHEEATENTACDMDIYCISSLEKAVGEAPAVQPGSQKAPVAVLTGEISYEPVADRVYVSIQQDSPSRIHGPPLFLLNASFLN